MMEANRMHVRTIHKKLLHILLYLLIIGVGIVMVYPLVWMFFATFKTNTEIYQATSLIPQTFSLDGYITGWLGSGQYTYTTFFSNTFELVLPMVLCTLVSSSLVSYGFARFVFKGKAWLFSIMLATLMLPNSVILIPRYLMFRDYGWLDSYLPFWIPALFACYPFFNYLLVQFLRGIPIELDESAYLDGCGTLRTFVYVILPLLKSALVSVCIFQLIWTWNDFLNPMIYISSVKHYPLSLALRMNLDVAATSEWNSIMAMSLLSILPLVVLFFTLQKYFIEGIATSGLKG